MIQFQDSYGLRYAGCLHFSADLIRASVFYPLRTISIHSWEKCKQELVSIGIGVLETVANRLYIGKNAI